MNITGTSLIEQSRQLLLTARNEAEELRVRVNSEVESIRETARAEAYESAYQEACSNLLSAMETRRCVLKAMHKAVLDIAIEIARNVITQEVECGRDGFEARIEKAIAMCADEESLTIEINPKDERRLKRYLSEMSHPFHSSQVRIRCGTDISPGDLIIKLGKSAVESSLTRHLETVAEHLRNAISEY